MPDYRTHDIEQTSSKTVAATPDEITEYKQSFPEWEIREVDGVPRLARQFAFADFKNALHFVAEVGKHAEWYNHHPRLIVTYGGVGVEWWTHVCKGLHKNDFIMAAHTDDVYSRWDVISGAVDAVDQASVESFPASDPPGY